MLRFLQRKVPLWVLLLAGIVIAAESVQIISEIKLRSDHQRYCMAKIRAASDGIYQNLEYLFPNKDDEEIVSPSLIGAYHYSNDLNEEHYFTLRRIAFADGKSYTGYDAQKFITFGYVNSTLEQILNEYSETHTLSEKDYETLQLFCEEFRSLSETITENPYMSNEQFLDCISNLYNSIYPKQQQPYQEGRL